MSLKIAILNLMPDKITTEAQFSRLLKNEITDADIKLIKLETYKPKTAPENHMKEFYTPFSEALVQKFDGFIITGSPVEHLEFEQVSYWDELCKIMDWALSNVTSTLCICWGAQAALYYHYGISKVPLEEKLCGVFPLQALNKQNELIKGLNDPFNVPQSRWSGIDEAALYDCDSLEVFAASEKVGTHIAASKDLSQVFVLGHMEYDADTLAKEFIRDCEKGLDPAIPFNYFPDDNPLNVPINSWEKDAKLFFKNWIDYIKSKER